MASSIRSTRVRRIPSGRTNKSRRSTRSMPRLRPPSSPALVTPLSPATHSPPRQLDQLQARPSLRRPSSRTSGARPGALASPVVSTRPRTAPSSSRSGSGTSVREAKPRGVRVPRNGGGVRANPGAGVEAVDRRSSNGRRSSNEEIRRVVADSGDHEDLPEMFQFSKRKKRLLHKYQYEVLWKQAQQKLTTNLYARYATLVSMFRAFDEDKDGRITFDEFEGRLKKMWDPAHYKGWEARVLFNSVKKPGATTITFPEMQGLFKSSPKTLPGALYSMDGTAVHQDETAAKEEQQQLLTTEKRMNEIKTKLVQKVHQKQKMTKAYRKDTQFLMQTFKNFDTNMNGVLSYAEVRNALGPKNLNLGLNDQEILDLCLHADAEDSGSITYKNFIDALATVDIERNYDPFEVGRVMDIQCMRRSTGQDYLEDPSNENSKMVPSDARLDDDTPRTSGPRRNSFAPTSSRSAKPVNARTPSKSRPGSRRASRLDLEVDVDAPLVSGRDGAGLAPSPPASAWQRANPLDSPLETARSIDAHSFYAPNPDAQALADSRRSSKRGWSLSPHEMGETFEWRPYSPPPSVPVVMKPTQSLESTLKSTNTVFGETQTPWAYQTTRNLTQASRPQSRGIGQMTATSRPRTAPNPLFSQLRQKVPPHSTRFSANPPRKETGGRVGVGGRGPNRTSAFFMSENGRFTTTTNTLFSNRQEVVDAGSISRQQAMARTRRREVRTRVLKNHKQRLTSSIRRAERKARRNDRIRVGTKSRQRLRYLEHLQHVEESTQIMGAGKGINGNGTPSTRNKSSDWFEHNI